jgi:mRNA interferase RelE/StbE
MFEILIEEDAIKELSKLQKKSKDKIIEKLKLLEKGFSPLLDIKKLKGYQNHYRLRVGKFRILFFLENSKIVVYKIGKRESVYE